MSTSSAPKTAYALMIILLIIGIAVGYGIGALTAPGKVVTTTVTSTATVTTTAAPGAAVTVTKTVTQTVTATVTAAAPGAAPGLKGDVLIGALLPLTGVLSSYGENDKIVLEMAAKEINEWLAARGEPWRIKLVIEDTATDPKTALDKIQALHGRGVKIFIGPMSSAEVSEIKSYADANKLLVISQSSTSPALAIPGDFIFRFCPTDVAQGPAIAKVMWDRGIRWVVPIWRGDTWGDGLKEFSVKAFEEICKASGEECGVVSGIRYDPAAKEFSAEMAKLASIVKSLADKYGKDKVGVLAISFEEIAAIFAAAKAHTILSEVRWQGSDGTAGIAILTKDPELAEFVIKVKFLSTIAAPGKSPFTEKVRKWVLEKLGKEPEAYAYFAYDALWVITLALEAVDKYDPEAVKNVIPSILEHYLGASGHFSLDENGDRATGDYNLLIVRKVEGKYVWDIAGTYRAATEKVEWAPWWTGG